jgi:hypothetical protein
VGVGVFVGVTLGVGVGVGVGLATFNKNEHSLSLTNMVYVPYTSHGGIIPVVSNEYGILTSPKFMVIS